MIIGAVFLVLYLLPNLFNFRERRYFSENRRLKLARTMSEQAKDSVTVIPGEYYGRGGGFTYFFGTKNRDLWTTPVKFPVFVYDTVKAGMVPYQAGGSQQTISIRLKDSSGRHWVMRSVNKDQQNVLPWWLRSSILRPVFRDQVAAMNPYGARVVASLSAAAGLPHLDPQIYWVPFVPRFGEFNERIAGRLVYLEQHLDSSWIGAPGFGTPSAILDAEEMLEAIEDNVAVDTLLYLKTRLFDMLVNDWDRHKDQWRWLLCAADGRKVLKPLARDRDIAFYVFDEGLVSKAAIRANEKFQSFRPQFGNVAGLVKQSRSQDRLLLKGVARQHFLNMARELQQAMTPAVVEQAFRLYPPVIYQRYGGAHQAILISRSAQLQEVALKFYQLVNDH